MDSTRQDNTVTTERQAGIDVRNMITRSFTMISSRECQWYISPWMKGPSPLKLVNGAQEVKPPNLQVKLDVGIVLGVNDHGIITDSLGRILELSWWSLPLSFSL